MYEAVTSVEWEDWIPANGYLSVISSVDTKCIDNVMYANMRCKDAVVDRIRSKLDSARDEVTARVERIGMKVEYRTPAGMFLWVDTGTDTIALTEKAFEKGFLLAPGSLFSPHQLPSTHMRLNVAAMSDSSVWDFLVRELD